MLGVAVTLLVDVVDGAIVLPPVEEDWDSIVVALDDGVCDVDVLVRCEREA